MGSRPSVQDPQHGVDNMKLYLDISLQQMSSDFEVVRKELGIEKWLVFGGSWGSLLSLDYAIRFPDCCLGLIVRGIMLGTVEEHDALYARKSFADQADAVRQFQLKQFDVFFDYARKEIERQRSLDGMAEPPLDPDDSERICRVYESLILKGDRMAVWLCYAFEENLMAEEGDLISYNEIDESLFPEAVSTAFFEMRLFVRIAFEEHPQILERLGALASLKTWVVQGTGDAVCPEKFARTLVAGLERTGVAHKAYFVEANHFCSSDNIKAALQKSVVEFSEEFLTTRAQEPSGKRAKHS